MEFVDNYFPTLTAIAGALTFLAAQFGFQRLSNMLSDPEQRKRLKRAKAGYAAAKAMRLWLIEEGYSREQVESFTWETIEEIVADRNSGWPPEGVNHG